MALKESVQLNKTFKATEFQLLDTISGKEVSLNQLKGSLGTVILFVCNHCPFVIHINKKLIELANLYQNKGVHFIAISSNDVENYPQDGPEKMKELALQQNFPFPYLYDATQEVAKAYQAVCTPDIYVFDSNLSLAYHGQFDSSRPGNNIPVSGSDLSLGIENMLLNKDNINSKPSIGCNIKWQ